MHQFGKVLSRTAVIAAAALMLTFCGGGGNKSGGSPTQPVEPTPTPITQPTPEPPISASCARLPLGSSTYRCWEPGPTFLGEVSDAVDTLKKEHPEYFDGDIVNNIGGYYVGVIKLLDKQNICAGFDGEELAVKNSPDFNDQFKLMTSWGQVRKFYVGTCFPAVFPINRSEPAPSPAGCMLPPSSEIACGKPPAQFDGEVESAIDQVMAQKPELFDPSQHAPGNSWPMVKDMTAYSNAVIAALSQKGYCGKFDGEEIQIKRTNEFTEHYDINFADQYVRRGAGAYRGSCYPAAF
jgi:hypothetical protein